MAGDAVRTESYQKPKSVRNNTIKRPKRAPLSMYVHAVWHCPFMESTRNCLYTMLICSCRVHATTNRHHNHIKAARERKCRGVRSDHPLCIFHRRATVPSTEDLSLPTALEHSNAAKNQPMRISRTEADRNWTCHPRRKPNISGYEVTRS